MLTLELARVNENEHGMFGILRSPFGHLCYTLEPNWNDNLPGASCIPSGQYVCEYVTESYTGKFKDCYWVMAVHKRKGILIHKGNLKRDTVGCIIPGTAIGPIGLLRGVLFSGMAMRKLHQVTERKDFLLNITDYVLVAKHNLEKEEMEPRETMDDYRYEPKWQRRKPGSLLSMWPRN